MRTDSGTRCWADTHTAIVRIAVIVAMVIASGCAATHQPARWSKGVADMPENVYGSWIWLTLKKTSPAQEAVSFGGELIAVSADSVYVAAPAFRALPRRSIAKARLAAYDASPEEAGFATFIGSTLTLSNGVYLLFTWPMWILGGTAATIAHSFAPVIDYPSDTFEEMSAFARFPGGLPPDLERSTIVMILDERKPFGF